MKKSVYIFLAIVLAVFVSDRVAYGIIRHFEKQILIGDSAGKVNYFNKVKDSMDILIFGSSRAVHHVNPEVFGVPTFNMGVDGKRIAYATGLIQTLKKKNQTIFVHIDHNKLYDMEYDGIDVLSLLNKSTDEPELGSFLMEIFPKDVWISKIFKCYAYNGKVFPIFKNYFYQGKNVESNGFLPLFPSEEQKAIFQNIVEKRKEPLVQDIDAPYKINGLVDKCIERIVQVGKKNGSEIIFFTSPSLFIIDEDVRAHTKSYFDSKGIKYIDDVNFFKGIDFDLWQDYTHMSDKGAEIYSQRLLEEFKELNSK